MKMIGKELRRIKNYKIKVSCPRNGIMHNTYDFVALYNDSFFQEASILIYYVSRKKKDPTMIYFS